MTWTHLGDGIYRSSCGTYLINENGGTRRPYHVTLQRTDGLPIYDILSGWWPFCPCSSFEEAEQVAMEQYNPEILSPREYRRAYYPVGHGGIRL